MNARHSTFLSKGTGLGKQSVAIRFKRRATIIVLFLFFGLAITACSHDKETEKLEATIKQELPTGSKIDDAKKFLEKYKIPYQDSNEDRTYKGPRQLWGTVTQSRDFGLFATDFILTFEFDEKDQMKSYKIKKKLVGP